MRRLLPALRHVLADGLARLLPALRAGLTLDSHTDTRSPNHYRHDIDTATVIPSQEKGLDRFRFWQRTKVVAQ